MCLEDGKGEIEGVFKDAIGEIEVEGQWRGTWELGLGSSVFAETLKSLVFTPTLSLGIFTKQTFMKIELERMTESKSKHVSLKPNGVQKSRTETT